MVNFVKSLNNAIDCVNLSVWHAKTPLLQNVTFQVKAGEIVGLIGSNGAGKSTLLKAMVGLIPGTQGTCRFFNDAFQHPYARRHFIFLPEKFHVASALTPQDFLQIMFGDSVFKQIENLCDLLEFPHTFLTKKVRTLSKGTLQKLGLLYLFAGRKPILIADELMSGLDMKTRSAVLVHLKKLRSEGCTILFSTHLLHDVSEVCDRTMILEDGQIQ